MERPGTARRAHHAVPAFVHSDDEEEEELSPLIKELVGLNCEDSIEWEWGEGLRLEQEGEGKGVERLSVISEEEEEGEGLSALRENGIYEGERGDAGGLIVINAVEKEREWGGLEREGERKGLSGISKVEREGDGKEWSAKCEVKRGREGLSGIIEVERERLSAIGEVEREERREELIGISEVEREGDEEEYSAVCEVKRGRQGLIGIIEVERESLSAIGEVEREERKEKLIGISEVERGKGGLTGVSSVKREEAGENAFLAEQWEGDVTSPSTHQEARRPELPEQGYDTCPITTGNMNELLDTTTRMMESDEASDTDDEEPDSDEERIKDLGPLSLMESAGVGSVLEDAVNQLSILAHTARASELSPDLAARSLDERLEAMDATRGTERPLLAVSPQTLHITDESAMVDKIQRDRALVQEALRLQVAWLRLPPSAAPLRRLVRDEERRARQEARLLAESVRGARRGHVLRERARAEERQARAQLRALREERAQLQEEARSLRARAALGAAVTERWERARTQQHERRLHAREQDLARGVQHNRDQLLAEQRVHCELVEFLTQAIEDLETQSEEWQARHAEVTVDSEEKLSSLRERRQEQARQLRAVRKELFRRERFKRDFLAYKELRDHHIQERTRQNNAATRIQSWWRMTMVRKGLGPYRRVAKKKKKKKK